uniref:hypothetical protein n=1 Tax=uncultured Sphingomonas sp. TaxID=158754 RepID=UPI0035CC02F2
MEFTDEASKSCHAHAHINRPQHVLGQMPVALLFIVAFAVRAWQFGNPVVQIDEQFYLLAGDRLLHGALPYVDIWDRKPFGLFAIYAAIRLLGGSGIIQYQIVATLFAAATALTIARIGLRLTGARGATIAGIVYLVFILSSGGDGGQAPVFYNLPVALAALLLVKIQARPYFGISAVTLGCLAIALLGVAIQIKYTVVFEGMFFGIWLLILAWRKGVPLGLVIGLAALCASIALVPTVFVVALYWHLGFLDQLVFANFISIAQRSSVGLDIPGRLFAIAIHIALPAIVGVWAIKSKVPDRAAHNLVLGWSAAAVTGVLIFGTYHSHYALPLFAPLSVAGAPLYGDTNAALRLRRFRMQIGNFVVLIGLILGIGTMIGTRLSRGTGEAVYSAARMVGTAESDCIFVFSGDPILYHLTQSCLPTRFVFTTLLGEIQDATSMGVSQMSELRRTMMTRPHFVFMHERRPVEAQPAAWNYMDAMLRRDYDKIFREKAGHSFIVGYKRKSDIGTGPVTLRVKREE